MQKQIKLPFTLMCLLTLTTTAATAAMPTIKPGLWETTSTGFGKNPIKHTQCFTKQDVAQSQKAGDDYVKANCKDVKESKSGKTYISDMVCTDNGTKMINHTEVTLISANEIDSKTTSTVNGVKTVMQNHTKRLSDCTAKGNEKDLVDITDNKGKKHSLADLEQAIKQLNK